MVADPEDMRGWLRLSPRITTSGRLLPPDPARLAAIGTMRVIDLSLADHPEALPDAPAAMRAAGLDYVHIPVPFDAPGDAHYRAFVAAVEEADGPVHVHCIMNYRVSAFFYRWHREACGMAEAAARDLLERVWSPHTGDQDGVLPWRDFVTRVGE